MLVACATVLMAVLILWKCMRGCFSTQSLDLLWFPMRTGPTKSWRLLALESVALISSLGLRFGKSHTHQFRGQRQSMVVTGNVSVNLNGVISREVLSYRKSEITLQMLSGINSRNDWHLEAKGFLWRDRASLASCGVICCSHQLKNERVGELDKEGWGGWGVGCIERANKLETWLQV